jgi:hypothetical protein
MPSTREAPACRAVRFRCSDPDCCVEGEAVQVPRGRSGARRAEGSRESVALHLGRPPALAEDAGHLLHRRPVDDPGRFALEDDVDPVQPEAAGAWVFAGGLHLPSTATVVRLKDGDVLTTDGPFAEGKEHIGGFTIVKAPDLDAALEWGRKLNPGDDPPSRGTAVPGLCARWLPAVLSVGVEGVAQAVRERLVPDRRRDLTWRTLRRRRPMKCETPGSIPREVVPFLVRRSS